MLSGMLSEASSHCILLYFISIQIFFVSDHSVTKRGFYALLALLVLVFVFVCLWDSIIINFFILYYFIAIKLFPRSPTSFMSTIIKLRRHFRFDPHEVMTNA